MKIHYCLFFVFFSITLTGYAQFSHLGNAGKSGPVLLYYNNGTIERGIIKNDFHVWGFKFDDPANFKFKSESSADFQEISSNDVKSVSFYDEKSKELIYTYYPIRIRGFKSKYKFSDKYYVRFMTRRIEGPINVSCLHTFINNKYIGDDKYIQIGGTEYYYLFDNAYMRTKKEAAKFVSLLGGDCEGYQNYVKDNFIEGDGHNKIYKPLLKEFKSKKKEIIADFRGRGYSKKETIFNML